MAFTWDEAIKELDSRRARALELGGPAKIERQRSTGRQTARERIEAFVDPGSFKEVGTLATYERLNKDNNAVEITSSSFLSGLAKVDGRNVALGVNDYTVSGGTTTVYLDRLKGEIGGFTDDLAYEYKIPLVSLLEGAGAGDETAQARGHGGVPGAMSHAVPGAAYHRTFALLDEVPCLTAILGPTAGFAAGRAVLAHFNVMTKDTACIFMGGPPVVKNALGIDVDKFDLGGSHIHTRVGGVDNIAEDETDAFAQIRRVLSYLPQNVWQAPPVVVTDDPITRRNDALLQLMPENNRRPYDPRKFAREIFDRDSFFEIGANWGRSIVQGLARIGGYPVGTIISNPIHLGGALDAQSCDKQSRFMEFCDTFHLPLVMLIDNGGFMIGVEAEQTGIARAAMRAMMAVLWIDVPIVSVFVRKAYGLGPMSQSNPVKLGLKVAWPTLEMGGMPAGGEVDAMFRRQIEEAEDPEAYRREALAMLQALRSPWKTAEHFGVEEIIHPAETREYVGRFIEASWEGMTSRLGPPKRRPRI
jgi:acetyl-CoA carboxylase carboxyltransferase component